MSGDEATVRFFYDAIGDLAGIEATRARVLDFGCGRGGLVDGLVARGVDAFGCDVDPYWEGPRPRLRPITRSPYSIPYEENVFDVVISTSVLEHAQNTEELFNEIKRVLRPGGYAIHLYPGKWYLPSEPHIYVPLANILWPNIPRWWLACWALLGVRNEFQTDMDWRRVVALNDGYCTTGLCYIPKQQYRQHSLKVFGNCEWPMHYFLSRANGGVAKLYRALPGKSLWAWLASHTRMSLLIHRKSS